MMASAKRKQDEKNLKILRELVSLPGNKECFDCHQRGPTYVNMTIGSFVCTSCSGMLRGLTPPHRVKSISMATFTQEEIDFIKEHGNESCRKTWLGLMNANSPQNLDAKDEQKMKDLMSAKYELKRYYLDPFVASQNQNQNTTSSQKSLSSGQTSIPRVPQSGTTVPAQKTTTTTTKSPEPVNASANSFTPDFVADFSKVPDPFLATSPVSKLSQPIVPQPFFANFDNNPVFNNAKSTAADTLTPFNASNSGNSVTTASNMNGATSVPPSEDRYAALKDLDSLMKQTQLKEDTTTSLSANTWHANNANAANSIWSGANQTSHVISNPFTSGDLWRPSANLVNNNMQNVDSQLCSSANPFKPMPLPVNNGKSLSDESACSDKEKLAAAGGDKDPQWMSIGAPTNGDVIQFSQLMTPLTNKVWQPTVPAYHANPFMVGSGVSNMTRNSNNPFL